MLVKKGYLKKKVGLYATLEDLKQDTFFPNGVPGFGFHKALLDRVGQVRKDGSSFITPASSSRS
jgi:hypothetical protein